MDDDDTDDDEIGKRETSMVQYSVLKKGNSKVTTAAIAGFWPNCNDVGRYPCAYLIENWTMDGKVGKSDPVEFLP